MEIGKRYSFIMCMRFNTEKTNFCMDDSRGNIFKVKLKVLILKLEFAKIKEIKLKTTIGSDTKQLALILLTFLHARKVK